VGGTPWLLDGGACGILVPSETPTAMADAIGGLLNEPNEGSRLARAARRRVLAEFDHAAMVRTYERLYRQIARGSLASNVRES
jgi:glycosyltransferase involved in cell wall biosynthesis